MTKRLFQVMDEMNQLDSENNKDFLQYQIILLVPTK